MHPYQIPLGLKLRDDSIFENFFVGKNAQLIDALQLFLTQKSEQFIYCYGEPGVGRTHLLQACCHAAAEKNETIFYLPLSNYAEYAPEIFEALENQHVVCIDDVDAITGNNAWEEALFHFYNRARENHVSLLVSAQQPPTQSKYTMPDLQSRLCWGLTLEISGLADAEKIHALQMRSTLRGLQLSDDVGNYLLHHYSRNMRDLFLALEKLDHASLAAKRRLTIPFVKLILQTPVHRRI